MHPAFRSFAHRGFRIFFAGQAVSTLGTWMQIVATSWLVYRLSGSAFLLGLAAGAQQLPILFLAPIAGVWADRVDRRRLLVAAQALAAAQALLLAVLTFAGAVQVWHVIALALLLGVVNAFETPTRQAFLLDLVHSRDDLPNAIALQSMLFNSARFVGPSIAGIVLAALGEAWCFTLNGVSFVAIVVAYLLIPVHPRARPPSRAHWAHELVAGIRYGYGFVATRNLLLLLAAVSIAAAPWQSLMPIVAAETFGGDSRTLGFLVGAVGLGALAATVFLAFRSSVRGLGRLIVAASLAAGCALMAFGLSTSFWLSLALLPVFGFGLIATVASSNTVLQTVAEEDKRGRVISLFVMSFLGVAPIGNFAAGAVAETIGAHWTFFGCGLILVAASATFASQLGPWRASVRDAYARGGIVRDERP